MRDSQPDVTMSHNAALNNPFILLEKTWQDVNNQKNSDKAKPSSPDQANQDKTNQDLPSYFGDGNEDKRQQLNHQQMNLSSLCISTIFQIEDKHLPSPLLKIYLFCWKIAIEKPHLHNAQNAATLRLCNYLFRKWHDTRGQLNFFRDTLKVGVVFGRRFNDNLAYLERAIDECTIKKNYVLTTLLRQLKKDTRGMNLGDYLAKYDASMGAQGLPGMMFNLFSSDEALGDEQNDGYLYRLLRRPTIDYLRQVARYFVRNIYRLQKNASASATLFEESVPSWAEDKPRFGQQPNTSDDEDRQLREDILATLLNPRPFPSQDAAPPFAKRHKPATEPGDLPNAFPPQDAAPPFAKRHKPATEPGDLPNAFSPQDAAPPSAKRHKPATEPGDLPTAPSPMTDKKKDRPPETLSSEEDELTSIDTRSFRQAMTHAPCYVTAPVIIDNDRQAGDESLTSPVALTADNDANAAPLSLSPANEILDNEYQLTTLLTSSLPQEATVLIDDSQRQAPCATALLFENPVIPEMTPSTRLTLTTEEEKPPYDNASTMPEPRHDAAPINTREHNDEDKASSFSDEDEEEDEEAGF